jgi:DNA-binding Lrp family transcriptional regulator
MPKWGFLTNHAVVIIRVYEHPQSTLREIANAVGITERAALSILRQLEEEELIRRAREGRRNRYTVNVAAALSVPTQGPYTIQEIVRLLAALLEEIDRQEGRPPAPASN